VKHLAALAFALLCPVFGWAQYNSYTAYAVGTAPSYEGLWWNPSESGWGVSLAHQGDVLFAVWYTYDHDGEPTWFFMDNARLVGDDIGDMMGMMDMSMMGMVKNAPMYTGSLYRSSKVGGRVVMTEVGMATFLFKDKDHAAFAYTVGNVSQSKNISRMAFAQADQQCTLGGDTKALATNFQDLWWNPSDSGWGVNIAHQVDNRGDALFATYYTYDADGKGVWYAMSDVREFDMMSATLRGFGGVLYRGTGPSFDSAWDSSKVHVTAVGSGEFRFDATGHAEFGATPFGNPTAARRDMTRMQFAAPASVCH